MLANAFPDGRIVGGVAAKLGDYPYIVSIREDGNHFCGGALITWRWILTAAHCLCDAEISGHLTVQAGFIYQDAPGSCSQEKDVVQRICHANYTPDLTDNDIGLAKVNTEFTLSKTVDIIALPSSGAYVLPQTAVVSGWGALTENGEMSNILYELRVNILPWNECNDIYIDEFSDLLICAGFMQGGNDTCQGDSGGPLTCYNEGRVLCAIVAAGQGCARPGFPGIYTPVHKFLDWIQQNIN
ncbi:hypothetical protein R5R35_000429 [Gryllus longicercus]|uniref:Peptidase S1 domain-containing protein n=1 Tax=Gryllus longicercus TaxID=2509291 RepID=A0AAN9VAV8_9ORTH